MKHSFFSSSARWLVLVVSVIFARGLLAQPYTCYRSDIDSLRFVPFHQYDNVSTHCLFDVDYAEDGSLYVTGDYDKTDISFDGVRLYPDDYSTHHDIRQYGVFVAKYDTSMELQWIKFVSVGPMGSASVPHIAVRDNKVLLGFGLDIFFASINLPAYSPEECLWVFDSLYCKPHGEAWQGWFPYPFDTISSLTCFVELDSEGNAGQIRTLARRPSPEEAPGIYPVIIEKMVFDRKGNLYMDIVTTSLRHTVFELDRSATQRYVIDVDSATVAKRGSAMHYILKFDEYMRLLWAKPRYDSISGVTPHWQYNDDIKSFTTDEEGNLYALYLSNVNTSLYSIGIGGRIWLDSTHVVDGCDINYYYIVKYSPDGDILWCNQLHTVCPAENDMAHIGCNGNCCTVLDGDHLILFFGGFKGGDLNKRRTNCFFDREHQHPFEFSHRYQCVWAEYDTRTGAYIHHDTVPDYEGSYGGRLSLRPDYFVGGVNVSQTHNSGYHYIFRRNRQTGDIYYGNPSSIDYWHMSRNLWTNSYGHVCELYKGIKFYYDSILDTRRRPVPDTTSTDTTGISLPLVPAFTLSPNPTTGDVTVEVADWNPDMTLELLDLQGRLLHHYTLHTAHCTLDLSPLPAGTYLLRLTTPTGTATQRLVKQ